MHPHPVCPKPGQTRVGHPAGQTMIIVGDTVEAAQRSFDDVTVMAELHNPYTPPWENRPVLLCRHPKHFRSLAEAWPQFKNWD